MKDYCTVHTAEGYSVSTLFFSGFAGTTHPPNWQKYVDQLDPNNRDNNGYENEDLIVWMRTSALPTFRKLYRKVNHTGIFRDGLPKGDYQLNVTYSILLYNVHS